MYYELRAIMTHKVFWDKCKKTHEMISWVKTKKTTPVKLGPKIVRLDCLEESFRWAQFCIIVNNKLLL